MQPEEIILLPATHESVACFHVKEEVLPHFLRHLGSLGIDIPEPPEPQGSPEISYVKVNVKEGTSEERLHKVLDDFVRKRTVFEAIAIVQLVGPGVRKSFHVL